MAKKRADNFDTPALDAYIKRIGAEMCNFRRYMVKEYKAKYYYERSRIEIKSDGTIECSTAAHLPLKEEAEAIKTEIAKLNSDPKTKWPTSGEGAPNITKLRITKDKLFEFWDRDRKKILMCQQRIDQEDGGKAYIPWSFWSDGEWRNMEPDGKLPFWKPKPSRNKAQIMIHEGAKSAAFVDGLVNDPSRKKELKSHPWGEELSQYEHWGMIGGALAPQRADYKELWDEAPNAVVYVCDNDYFGRKALEIVSKHYGRQLMGIKFGEEFPYSWDLADPMPENLFKGKRWNGKRLEEYKHFATYATETLPAIGKGRPASVLKDCFAQEWIHCISPCIYIHKEWPGKIYTTDEFDEEVHAFSSIQTTSSLMTANEAVKVSEIKYDPGKPPGMYGRNGMHFNTYCPSTIKEEKGDYKPFEHFMNNLFPIEHDRTEVMRWVATLISRPDVKMTYALLLISETQGVGKGTLGDRILKPILGYGNVSSPSENEVVEGNYTYWMAHRRLAVINEIYAGHSSMAYNKLKPLITDPTITVRKKFLADYEIDNWLHLFACSNNFNALKLTGEDRRWLIPKVTEEKQNVAYWAKFNRWLSDEGGLGIIMYWAKEFLKTNKVVEAGEVAPWSTTKLVVVGEGYTPGIQMCANVLDMIKRSVDNCPEGEVADFKRCIMMDTDFIALIQRFIPERQISYGDRQAAIRGAAKTIGWHVHPDKAEFRDGTRGRLICLDPNDISKKPSAIFSEVIPTRIMKLENRFLVIDGDTGKLEIERSALDDDRTIEAIKSGKFKLKEG